MQAEQADARAASPRCPTGKLRRASVQGHNQTEQRSTRSSKIFEGLKYWNELNQIMQAAKKMMVICRHLKKANGSILAQRERS